MLKSIARFFYRLWVVRKINLKISGSEILAIQKDRNNKINILLSRAGKEFYLILDPLEKTPNNMIISLSARFEGKKINGMGIIDFVFRFCCAFLDPYYDRLMFSVIGTNLEIKQISAKPIHQLR